MPLTRLRVVTNTPILFSCKIEFFFHQELGSDHQCADAHHVARRARSNLIVASVLGVTGQQIQNLICIQGLHILATLWSPCLLKCNQVLSQHHQRTQTGKKKSKPWDLTISNALENCYSLVLERVPKANALKAGSSTTCVTGRWTRFLYYTLYIPATVNWDVTDPKQQSPVSRNWELLTKATSPPYKLILLSILSP